jgi:hypothetical protein
MNKLEIKDTIGCTRLFPGFTMHMLPKRYIFYDTPRLFNCNADKQKLI